MIVVPGCGQSATAQTRGGVQCGPFGQESNEAPGFHIGTTDVAGECDDSQASNRRLPGATRGVRIGVARGCVSDAVADLAPPDERGAVRSERKPRATVRPNANDTREHSS